MGEKSETLLLIAISQLGPEFSLLPRPSAFIKWCESESRLVLSDSLQRQGLLQEVSPWNSLG